jgi:hypothetical protein
MLLLSPCSWYLWAFVVIFLLLNVNGKARLIVSVNHFISIYLYYLLGSMSPFNRQLGTTVIFQHACF